MTTLLVISLLLRGDATLHPAQFCLITTTLALVTALPVISLLLRGGIILHSPLLVLSPVVFRSISEINNYLLWLWVNTHKYVSVDSVTKHMSVDVSVMRKHMIWEWQWHEESHVLQMCMLWRVTICESGGREQLHALWVWVASRSYVLWTGWLEDPRVWECWLQEEPGVLWIWVTGRSPCPVWTT